MTVETGSFLLPIRRLRRNCSEHLGQVATAKGMPYFNEDWGRRANLLGQFAASLKGITGK